MRDWEPWQEKYRFGVPLLFPPEPLRTEVNRLRLEHDPRSQSYCDAHISLTVPLPRALNEDDWARLNQVASYRCDTVSYAVPDEGFHFVERGRLSLGVRLHADQ